MYVNFIFCILSSFPSSSFSENFALPIFFILLWMWTLLTRNRNNFFLFLRKIWTWFISYFLISYGEVFYIYICFQNRLNIYHICQPKNKGAVMKKVHSCQSNIFILMCICGGHISCYALMSTFFLLSYVLIILDLRILKMKYTHCSVTWWNSILRTWYELKICFMYY